MLLMVFGGFPCVWVTSPRRGFALEKKRLRAFGDRLSVDGARRGIVNAKAAPSSSMVNREKGRGMRKWMYTQVLKSHLIFTLTIINTITCTLG